MTTPERNWVWRSDEESRAAGKISVLAIVETITAVFMFWWLTSKFDTAFVLITSPIFAFLYFLKSFESAIYEKTKIKKYFHQEKVSLKLKLITLLFAISVAVAAFHQLLPLFSGKHLGFRLLFQYSLLALLCLNLGLLVSGILSGNVAMVLSGAVTDALKDNLPQAGNVGIAAAVSGLIIGLNAAEAAVAAMIGAIAGAISITLFSAISKSIFGESADSASNAISNVLILIFIGPGVFAGVAARVLLVRARANFLFLGPGLKQFNRNWLNLAASQDIFFPAELTSLSQDGHNLSFQRVMKLPSGSPLIITAKVFALPFFYLPSVLLRYTLKSTAWLYLPVIWIAHYPTNLRDSTRQLTWVKTAGRNWLALLSALAVLAYALFLAFDPEAFRAMRQANDTQMFTPFHLIWAIDPAGWKLWFWVTIPSAVLTIIMWVWVNKIRAVVLAGGQLDWHSTQLRCLIALNQVKNAFVVAWMVMTFLSVARAGWLLDKLPDWMEPIFLRFVLPVTGLWSS